MSYNALRKGRASLVGQAYLVTTVTASRIPLFADLYAGRIIVNAMREQDAAGTTSTLAYVVMPDHVHWLVKLETDASLASVIKQLKGGTARRLNRCANRLGAVWQPSFHDHAIREEESLVDAARYVIMNPVRAGLVDCISGYSLWDAAWDMSDCISL